MLKGKTLAFHSYKGGTGKTTLITNLAASFAKNGKRVCLLDFDLYAPSLATYFRKKPTCYLYDVLNGNVDISDILIDVSSDLGLKGKLFLGLSSPKKEDVQEIEMSHDLKWQLKAVRRFLSAKKSLIENYDLDYVLLDTGPGIRYWSINTLATADILFLTMKISDMDIEGTKKMAADIYDSLKKFGLQYYVILNKVPGASPIGDVGWEENEFTLTEELENDLNTKVIGTVPCFCDIQFNRHEFLFSIKKPTHLFSKKVIELSKNIEKIVFPVE
ncbi:MAG: MinD/ParA family protein [Candidatus Bathyarchaeota archaeon]|nr:MinD/ParA family protein [Candidatus Bathyarchaeota archaeon]